MDLSLRHTHVGCRRRSHRRGPVACGPRWESRRGLAVGEIAQRQHEARRLSVDLAHELRAIDAQIDSLERKAAQRRAR